MPTASAVMGDVMTVIRNILHDNCGWNGGLAYKRLPVKAIEETKNRFFLRLKISGKTGTLANIASVLGNNDVNIHQVVSKFTKDGTQELVITTGNVLEQDFNNALMILEGMSSILKVCSRIRVYG